MCIAVYIPKNKNISNEVIRNCFANNPDGAGVMWQDATTGKVHIQKGFFTEEALIKAFREIPQNVNRGLHCRIATSGKISSQCCHPFPITKDIKKMGKAEQIVDSAVIHNGIIPFCTPHEGLLSPFSDTMIFARDYLYPLGDKVNTIAFKNLFEESNSSKLCIFRPNQQVTLVGKWIEDGGVFYSNDGYKDTWHMYYYGKGYGINGKNWWATDNKASKVLPYVSPIEDDDDDIDISSLFFYIPDEGVPYSAMEMKHIIENIVSELDDYACVPDEDSLWETVSTETDGFSFTVDVLQTPPNNIVAGYRYYLYNELVGGDYNPEDEFDMVLVQEELDEIEK